MDFQTHRLTHLAHSGKTVWHVQKQDLAGNAFSGHACHPERRDDCNMERRAMHCTQACSRHATCAGCAIPLAFRAMCLPLPLLPHTFPDLFVVVTPVTDVMSPLLAFHACAAQSTATLTVAAFPPCECTCRHATCQCPRLAAVSSSLRCVRYAACSPSPSSLQK